MTASDLSKELLDNERKNFQLINAAVSDLGGIPSMIHHSDMSNTIPDEKVGVFSVGANKFHSPVNMSCSSVPPLTCCVLRLSRLLLPSYHFCVRDF